MNIRIGKISNVLTPAYSSCGKCKTTWKFVEPHFTNYTDSIGMFPLCEKCWSELTPEQRLPYYRELFEKWEHSSNVQWKIIKIAVLDNK